MKAAHLQASLIKTAFELPTNADPKAQLIAGLAGAAVGGGTGALIDRKKRWRGALIGAGLGGVAGTTGATFTPALQFSKPQAPNPASQKPEISGTWGKIKNWLNTTDNPHLTLDPGWGSVGGALVSVPAVAANQAYKKLFFESFGHTGAESAKLYKKLLKTSPVPVTAGAVDRYLKMQPITASRIEMSRPSPGVLAHEIGHAQGNPSLLLGPKGRVLTGLMQAGGTTGALLSQDEDSARNFALLGTAGYLPSLRSEIDASAKGYRALRDIGAGRLRSAGSFKGLPTYLMNAAIPLLSFGVKRMAEGYDRPNSAANYAAELTRMRRAGIRP